MSLTKKLAFAALSLVLATTLIGTVASSGAQFTSESKVEYSLEPSYYVEIPTSVNVNFRDNETDIGAITLSGFHLEEGKCVKISLDDAENTAMENQTYDYSLKFTVTDSEGNPFKEKVFTQNGTLEGLKVNITSDDWEKAPSGDYLGNATFNISYEDIAN